MEKKWIIRQSIDSTTVETFRSELKINSVVSELLLQRGIDTFEKAEHFFRPKLEHLHNPFLMKNMDLAVSRLIHSLENKEKILLFGDYDVDGTTAVALMYSFLKNHHSQLDYYIPDRYSEGYGLSKQGIDFAKENGFSLLILLDCGIKSVELVEYGKSIGLDFIICDHHQPGEIVPDTIVLDPKQEDCHYPYKELCGCGVGFKLLQGLTLHKKWKMSELYELLDFVAVAIGADIVPVTGENRILVHHGMRLLNEFPRTSFKRLLTLAKRSFPVTLTDVVFTIAPRINSAGRLYSGRQAVELMVTEDLNLIERLAKDIDSYNQERKELDAETTQQALEIMKTDSWYQQSKSTVVFHEQWHKGVVGIVASRLIENHFKPTIVLTENEGKLTGSARTVNNFDIYNAILSCEDLLEQFGGHTYAAGLTLKKENFELFRNKFDAVVKNTMNMSDTTPYETVDLELNFNEIYERLENRTLVPKLKRILKQMEPHGPGNMKPVFYTKNVFSKNVRLLKEVHLKLQVTQPDTDVVLEAIGFNLGHKELEVAEGLPFEMIYTLESNMWNGKESLQLNIKDIRPMI
jgi:single-stranded-DNA-specific exonuclease